MPIKNIDAAKQHIAELRKAEEINRGIGATQNELAAKTLADALQALVDFASLDAREVFDLWEVQYEESVAKFGEVKVNDVFLAEMTRRELMITAWKGWATAQGESNGA